MRRADYADMGGIGKRPTGRAGTEGMGGKTTRLRGFGAVESWIAYANERGIRESRESMLRREFGWKPMELTRAAILKSLPQLSEEYGRECMAETTMNDVASEAELDELNAPLRLAQEKMKQPPPQKPFTGKTTLGEWSFTEFVSNVVHVLEEQFGMARSNTEHQELYAVVTQYLEAMKKTPQGAALTAEAAIMKIADACKKAGKFTATAEEEAEAKRQASTMLARTMVTYTDKPKVLIALPCNWSEVPLETTVSIRRLKIPCDAAFFPTNDWTLTRMRNKCVETALVGGFTHLFFLDADMVYPEDTLPKLLADNKPMVQGLACRRIPIKATTKDGRQVDFHPAIFMKHKDGSADPYEMGVVLKPPETGTHPVDAVGMGGTLVQTNVFGAMAKPWFSFTKEDGDPVGEDVQFSVKARLAGFQPYVNCDVRYGHLIRMMLVWEKNGSALKYTWVDGEKRA